MTTTDRTVDDLADIRAGDKGDSLILAVCARDDTAYQMLVNGLTPDLVAQTYAPLLTGDVLRTLMPGVKAMVLTLPGALGGGVTGSPVLDGHGKTLGHHLLRTVLPRPSP